MCACGYSCLYVGYMCVCWCACTSVFVCVFWYVCVYTCLYLFHYLTDILCGVCVCVCVCAKFGRGGGGHVRRCHTYSGPLPGKTKPKGGTSVIPGMFIVHFSHSQQLCVVVGVW